ncbi:two-partner secretion domain-containing protein, partial [Bacterioplanoides pacificum]
MILATLRNRKNSLSARLFSALLISNIIFPAGLVAPVAAQLITDPNADVRFTPVIRNQHGVSVVDIVRPGATGISHNKYQDFNVDQNGLVFNNSLSNGDSYLAGRLAANPALGGRSASTILNEVTSQNNSELKGVMEVFGDKANIIIANPNGITCDGCGFINTGRLSLTTGRSYYDNEQLNFSVDNGEINFREEGLSYRYKPYDLDVLSRYVKVDGEINIPGQLNIVSGVYDINYEESLSNPDTNIDITRKDAATNAERVVAIDASVYGAMQAGNINIIGTEQGLGVKADGYLFSHADDLFIKSAGGLSVTDADAFKTMTLKADGEISVSDDLIANERIVVGADSLETSERSGFISQQLSLDISGQAALNGELKALEVDVKAGSLRSEADVLAIERLSIGVDGSSEFENSTLVSEQAEIGSDQLTLDHVLMSFSELGLTSNQAHAEQLTMQLDKADLRFGNLISSGIDLNANDLELKAGDWRDNQSQFSVNSFTLSADALSLTGADWVFSEGEMNVSEIALHNSRMYSRENQILAEGIRLVDSQMLSDELTIEATEFATRSSIMRGGNVILNADRADLVDSAVASNNLSMSADLSLGANSVALATDDMSISGDYLELLGSIKADNLVVVADQAEIAGVWQVAGDISAEVSGSSSLNNLAIGSGSFSLHSGQAGWGNVSLQASTVDVNVDAVLGIESSIIEVAEIAFSAEQMTVDKNSFINSLSTNVSVESLTNRGTLLSATELQLTAEDSIANTGNIASFSELGVRTRQFNNTGLLTSENFLLSAENIENAGDIGAEALEIRYQRFINQRDASLIASHANYRASEETAVFINRGEQVAENAIRWLKADDASHSGRYVNEGLLQGSALNFSGLAGVENGLAGALVSNGEVHIGDEEFLQKGRIETNTLSITRSENTFTNNGEIFADLLTIDASVDISNDGKVAADTAAIDLALGGASGNQLIGREGSILSVGDLTLTHGGVDNSGTFIATNFDARGNLADSTTSDFVNHETGVIVQRHRRADDGSVLDYGSASFSGFNQFTNQGIIESDELILIRNVNKFDNNEENLAAHQAAGTLKQAASINSTGGIVIDNAGSFSNSGFMNASSLFAEVNQFENNGVIGAGEAIIQLTDDPLVNNGQLYQSELVLTDAQRSRIFDDFSVVPGKTTTGLFEVYAGSFVNGDGAAIEISNGSIALTADRLENRGLIRELNDGNTETALHLNGIGILENYGDIAISSALVLNDFGTLNNHGVESYLQAGLITSAPAAIVKDIHNDGTLLVRDQIDLDALNIINSAGARVFANEISLTSQGVLANSGLIQSETDLSLKASRLHNSGELIGKGTTSVAVSHLDNEHLIYGNTLNVGSTSQRINEVSTLSAIRVQALAANQPTGLVAAETLNLYVSGIMGDVYQASNIFIDGEGLYVSGTVIGDNKIDIITNTLAVEQHGKINIGTGGGLSRWNIAGTLQNDGDIDFASDLNVTSSSFLNNANIRGEASLDINTDRFENRSVGIVSTKNSDLGSGSSIRISGLADGFSVADQASDWVNNGQVYSDGGLDVSAGNISVNGNVKALGNSQWYFDSLENNSRITIDGDWRLGAEGSRSGEIINNDRMYGGSILAYLNDNIDNTDGSKIVAYRNELKLEALGDISNHSGAVLYAKENFDIVARGSLFNNGNIESFDGGSKNSITASTLRNGDGSTLVGSIKTSGSLFIDGDVENLGLVDDSSRKEVFETVVSYNYSSWTKKTGPSYDKSTDYYWQHDVGYVSEEVSAGSKRSIIQSGGELGVNGNLYNHISDVSAVGDIDIQGGINNSSEEFDAVVKNIRWKRKTENNKSETNAYGNWIESNYLSSDSSKRKLAVDHLISEIEMTNDYYWKGPWSSTHTGNTVKNSFFSGDGSTKIINPFAIGTIYSGGVITYEGNRSFNNTGSLISGGLKTQNSDDQSTAVDAVGLQSNGNVQGQSQEKKGSFNNGADDVVIDIIGSGPQSSISLLSFVIPGLSFDALNAASVAGDKTPQELAAQAELQSQLDSLSNERQKNGQALQSQSTAHATTAPSLFDLDEDILSQIIADTEYELQPDYIFDRLTDTQQPDVEPIFFLDPYQEAQAVTQAALAQTGTSFFSPDWSSSAEQRKALYDNTLAYVEAYQNDGSVKLGKALTRRQIAQLEQPMIWYVAMDIGGQSQLVPTVYLPEATLEQITTPTAGTLIADTMDVDVSEFKNTGNISVANRARIQADVITNQRNVMRFGDDSNYNALAGRGGNIDAGELALNSQGDINNLGGTINSRGDLSLFAGGDINLSALQLDRRNQFGKNIDERTEFVTSQIRSGGNLTVNANGDLNSQAAQIDVAGNASINARDINLMGVTERTFEQRYSKKSGTFSSSKTTTQSEQLDFIGTNLNVGGDLALTADNNMTLQGTSVSAGNNIKLKAGNDILLTAGISQDSYSKDKKGSGAVTTNAHQQGYVKQTATASRLSGNNIQIDSDGGDVAILASELAAEENILLGDVTVKRDENGAPILDDNGQYITEDGSSINNLTIGTVELTDKSWDKKQSGLKGPLKDLAAAATLALSASGVGQLAMAAGVNPEITVGKSSETVVESTTHQTSTLNAGDKLIVRTDGDTRIEGADISANTAYLETRNTTITAVENTTTTTESQSTHTVAGTKGELKKDEVTVAGVTETKHKETTTTTDTKLKKSSISVGSLVMNSEDGINVLASDIEVEGDASVKANKIRIAGMTEETTTEHQEKTETTTTSVGVKNAYVDAAYAAEAVADAGAAVEDAQEALDDARRRVKDGTLAADAVSDYEANLAAATAQLSQATISLAASGATAAGTTGTGGFYASGSAEKTITEKTSTSTEQRYVGSSFNVGGDARFDAAQSIDIIGSSMDIGGGLGLNANDVTIKAGTEESTSSSTETTRTAGMTVSYGSGGSDLAGGVNASGSNTDSDSYSKTHINSAINAGSLSSNSENLTLSGANVEIAGDIDIETSNLLIESLQDVATSSSKTEGYNASLSMGADKNISPGSVGANQNNSKSNSKWVNNQTTLIGGSSGTGEVNISADKTTVRGAVVASATRNEDGTLTDNGTLNLTTDELIVEDIQDKNHSQSDGFNVSTSGYSGTGSTTVGLTSNGHEREQTTFATLGGGSVKNRDGEDHNLDHTNRDLNNSQQITKDQQTAGLDATVTVDHRLASEEGRNSIKKDFVDSSQHAQEIGQTIEDVATTDLGATDVFERVDDYATDRKV